MPEPSTPVTLALFADEQAGGDSAARLLVQYQRSRVEVEVFRTAEAARAAIAERRHDGYLIDAALLEHNDELRALTAGTGRPLLVLEDAHLRLLERAQDEARKLDAVARLASGVAHDLNNILTAILGYAEILRESFDPKDARRQDVTEILRAGQCASALTGKLLTIARRAPSQAAPLDLNAALVRLQPSLASLAGAGILLSVDRGSDLPAICLEPDRLETLLAALVSNARDAMPHGGRVRIKTCLVDLDQSRTATRPGLAAGPYALLSLSDEGCGMPADVRSHLFEPFFTTKAKGKGAGLGLAMVYAIVRQTRGHIEVQSEAGKGSTVRIYWPGAN